MARMKSTRSHVIKGGRRVAARKDRRGGIGRMIVIADIQMVETLGRFPLP